MRDINTILSILESYKRAPILVNDLNFIPYMGEFADSVDGESEHIEAAVSIIEHYLNNPSDTRSFAEYLFVLCSVIYKTFPSMHVHHSHKNSLKNKIRASELLIEAVDSFVNTNSNYRLYPLLFAAQAAVVSGKWSKAIYLYQLLLDGIKNAEGDLFDSEYARNRIEVQIIHNISYLIFQSGYRKQARAFLDMNKEVISVQEEDLKNEVGSDTVYGRNIKYYLHCLTKNDNDVLFMNIPLSWCFHPEASSYMSVGCSYSCSDDFFVSNTLTIQKVIKIQERQFAIKKLDDPSIYSFTCDMDYVSDEFDEDDPEGITFAQFIVSEGEYDIIGNQLMNRRNM